ncbi:MAG: GNAT family N-acetyltransferase [Planctomycetaceae bacterium]|nr:GNAT family N-acetyltransferase [Planctomycetaceae bacterium]
MSDNPVLLPTGRYRHYKGRDYVVLGVARHSETEEALVVYRPDYGERGLWVRPLAMFTETVLVEGQDIPRFAYVGPETPVAVETAAVRIRDVHPDDDQRLFEFQLDPIANEQAAMLPRSAVEYFAHCEHIHRDENVVAKAILLGDQLVGCVSCFPANGQHFVGYRVGREYWGKGVATRALELLLQEVTIRPLQARVALINTPSIRVLQKCGFRPIWVQSSPADGHYLACDEVWFELAE